DLDGFLRGRRSCVSVGEIDHQRFALQALCRAAYGISRDVEKHQLSALAAEASGNLQADATRRAGDDRSPPGETSRALLPSAEIAPHVGSNTRSRPWKHWSPLRELSVS